MEKAEDNSYRKDGRKEKGLITESLKILTERMIGADKEIILKAVSLLEHVDKEDHARTLETLIHKYNGHDDNYELLDSIECDEFKKELEDIDLDRKSAAKGRPIKHTHSHDTSARSINVDPVVTGAGMIGREGSRAISGRSITQEIPGGKS